MKDEDSAPVEEPLKSYEASDIRGAVEAIYYFPNGLLNHL